MQASDEQKSAGGAPLCAESGICSVFDWSHGLAKYTVRMLIAAGVTRAEARGELDRQSHEEAIPTGLLLARSRLELRMASWREYWSSARPFFEVDCRLPQRLNRLKASWRALLAWPGDEDVRRFNPAALITPSGRSVINQVCRVASCLVIEDVDLEPEHLRAHRASFGLTGHAAVRCAGDGFLTRAHQYVIGRPEQVQRIKGERLW